MHTLHTLQVYSSCMWTCVGDHSHQRSPFLFHALSVPWDLISPIPLATEEHQLVVIMALTWPSLLGVLPSLHWTPAWSNERRLIVPSSMVRFLSKPKEFWSEEQNHFWGCTCHWAPTGHRLANVRS
jgi:hypothetical protein